MDHTLLDVMILDDKQTSVRPWLTIVLETTPVPSPDTP